MFPYVLRLFEAVADIAGGGATPVYKTTINRFRPMYPGNQAAMPAAFDPSLISAQGMFFTFIAPITPGSGNLTIGNTLFFTGPFYDTFGATHSFGVNVINRGIGAIASGAANLGGSSAIYYQELAPSNWLDRYIRFTPGQVAAAAGTAWRIRYGIYMSVPTPILLECVLNDANIPITALIDATGAPVGLPAAMFPRPESVVATAGGQRADVSWGGADEPAVTT
jgi:hypothetical protein